MSTDKIKVAVRVRPFNRRELDLRTECVVAVDGSQIFLHSPEGIEKESRKPPKCFAFDHCFNSLDPSATDFAGQGRVFQCLGLDILDNAFDGYNACIFAYGQTGSGKSYSMMGSASEEGIIPRLCNALFSRIAERSALESESWQAKVEVSYMEIYNEKVHDLLNPSNASRHGLKVREHNLLGPYVDGLSQLAVTSYQEIENVMVEGNKSRTVAATNMNNESSRSHAVFSVILTQTLTDAESGVSGEKVSRMSLVDLAGSERAVKTGAVGERLKEGSNINKSLTTLGLVISKLADQASSSSSTKATASNANNNANSNNANNNATGKHKDKTFVPYRDSTLTWLLKDNLGGNSKTVMVATVSPAADNYEETLSTLRYADRAKRIVNHAVVNEDPNARIIRELRAEVDALKEMLKHATQPEVLREKLSENEKLMKEISLTWEEKLLKTGQTQEDRRQALQKVGISVGSSGISVEKDKFFLVNLNSDPSLNELLVYYLKEHTLVGRAGDPSEPDIQLSGVGIQPEHCLITLRKSPPGGGGEAASAELVLEPLPGARTCVNGVEIKGNTRLSNGDRILWGSNHFFRVNCPKMSNSDPTTPAVPFDWVMAQEEVMQADLSNDPIQAAIARLEKQYEEDKMTALEKQRLEYERHFQQLKNYMSPSTPYPPYMPYDPFQTNGSSSGLGSNANNNNAALQLNGNVAQNSGHGSGAGTTGKKVTPSTPGVISKLEKWGQERDETFKRSLAKLREDIVRANGLVREANFFAEEMGRSVRFGVTLQIPPQNLSPNRKRGAFVSEPAILVKRKGKSNQVWSVEKLDLKLTDMRELYDQDDDVDMDSRASSQLETDEDDPFSESCESHNLIGVANVFLACLFHKDLGFDYHTPIISQQGEVAGRLQVQIQRVGGNAEMQYPSDRFAHCLTSSEGSSSTDQVAVNGEDEDGSTITVKVTLKQATGLPPSLSHFVFCQYNFWSELAPTVAPPVVYSESPLTTRRNNLRNANGNDALDPDEANSSSTVCRFDHSREFTVTLTEEFVEHCAEGALSVEVYGHRSSAAAAGLRPETERHSEQQMAKARSLADRWSELTRKLQFNVEVQELGEHGEYMPVEVQPRTDVGTGGIFQLRQGQQRRIVVTVEPVSQSGTLPIICDAVLSIAVGAPVVRSKLQRPLDSYQEEDLNQLRCKWTDALGRRREYLEAQIQKYINKSDKTEAEAEREQSLVDQWVSLTEERNSVMVPAAGSGVPGAPADWEPPDGMETHTPVIYLDLNADDLSTGYDDSVEIPLFGTNSILPKEHGGKFFNLPIIRYLESEVGAVATWDSSIHDSLCLNRVTPANERAYLIVKSVVRLSHPTTMDLVLRKRICFNVYKRHSLTDKIRRKMGHMSPLTSLGVLYEIVSNIPKASEELEERESLAVMAASGQDDETGDGETFMEKYTRGVSAVETILTLDRLRQDVAIKELLNARGRSQLQAQQQQQQQQQQTGVSPFMRKTMSVPNFSQVMSTSLSLDNISSLSMMRTSESFSDLQNGEQPPAGQQQQASHQGHVAASNGAPAAAPRRMTHSTSLRFFPSSSTSMSSPVNGNASLQDQIEMAAVAAAAAKPFGLAARPTSLNLNFSLNARLQQQQQQQQQAGGGPAAVTSLSSSSLKTPPTSSSSSSSAATTNGMNGKPKAAGATTSSTRLMSTLHEGFDEEEEEEEEEEEAAKKPPPQPAVIKGEQPRTTTDSPRGDGALNASSTTTTNTTTSSTSSKTNQNENSSPKSGTSSQQQQQQQQQRLPASRTLDSLNELQGNSITNSSNNPGVSVGVAAITSSSKATGTPSMVSSGYGSQAVSSNTLSSDDSMSLRSISVDDTPDTEVAPAPNPKIHLDKAVAAAVKQQQQQQQQGSRSSDQSTSGSSANLLSPPDVSLTSISPGDEEETDNTMTSSNVTPCSSVGTDSVEQLVPSSATPPVKTPTQPTVIRRRHSASSRAKTAANNPNRSSYPSALSTVTENMSASMTMTSSTSKTRISSSMTSSTSSLRQANSTGRSSNSSISSIGNGEEDDLGLPDWMTIGESVQLRPSYSSGVIAFVGATEFASGLWIGIILDTPTGKNDGSVKGVRYFSCSPKHGVFVRQDKVQLDKRGRAMRHAAAMTQSFNGDTRVGKLTSSSSSRSLKNAAANANSAGRR